jgi:predicted SAM-dependent methyltransferase
VVGAGRVCPDGWIPTDKWFLDLLRPTDWHACFPGACIDAILAEHVWEHLTEEEGLIAAQMCFRYLKPGGYLRAAVPDGLDPDPNHVERARPGGTGPGAETHRVLYTWSRFKALFESAGFRVDMLEYYDEQAVFHAADWSPADGMIHRSKRFDGRTGPDEYHFASIILDAWKERAP